MAGTPHVVILGGGFGGLSVATTIRDSLASSQVRITVVDKKDWFMVGFAKLWMIRGSRTFEESVASLGNLTKRNIAFLKADIKKIDINRRAVEISNGTLEYDYLVVALGARLAPESIPGLVENGMNLYDPLQSGSIRERLLNTKSGSVAIAITGMPYKCPPAPFEAALIVSSMLRESGARDNVSVNVYSPAPLTMPAAGPQISARVLDMLQADHISFHGSCKVTGVDPGRLIFEGGDANFDLLLAVPPHTLPHVAVPLAGGNPFIRIDHFGRTGVTNVYAVGDITVLPTDTGAVPKAGVFAEGEGATVAVCIMQDINNGDQPEPFDGVGECFMESGRGTASIVRVAAFQSRTTLSDYTIENMDAKIQFERERLIGWLG